MLQREDPHLFTSVCMLIFKKHFKSSLIYCSPFILADLLKVTRSSKTGLNVFKAKVQDLFKSQRRELQSTKYEIYNRVSKFLPYDQPYYLLPRNKQI